MICLQGKTLKVSCNQALRSSRERFPVFSENSGSPPSMILMNGWMFVGRGLLFFLFDEMVDCAANHLGLRLAPARRQTL